jgi:DNA anti-recombination protein RmuC
MTATEELNALYKQWRRLTQTEGDAIRLAAWSQVDQCQHAKAQLQPRISEVASRIETDSHERLFRPVVDELIQLEQQNREVLQAHRQVAQQQKEELDKASRHLRQIHRSYVPLAAAHWQSYS